MIFQIGCEPMKKQPAKLLLMITASFLLVILNFSIYLYIQLSRNPMEGEENSVKAVRREVWRRFQGNI